MRTFIIAAITADGFIGRDSGHTADWTGKEDKKVFTRLTKEAGVMVMGSRTFATIGCALPERRTIVLTRSPDTITTEGIETTDQTPVELISKLQQEGVRAVAICGGTSVYDQFIRAGLVDELYLTISPLLFGQGLSLFTHTLS
ncbi:MAG TPA: dihydrofolate reductase family protein, partial [Verrucomicrobiae bacterium]|nr:dihydrofolate reductase family protein [Verrucomicrobiae bacterium]